MLYEAGINALSEPDFYTQFAHALQTDIETKLHADPLRRAVAAATNDLPCAYANSPQVVKLRAEVCLIADEILRLPPGRRKTIFLYRDFAPWARSSLRAFDLGANLTVAKYAMALRCLSFLRRHSDCLVIRYETLVRQPAETCKRLERFLERPIDTRRARRAFVEDAQTGTPLAQTALTYWDDEREAEWEKAKTLWTAPQWDEIRAFLHA